VTLAPGLAPAPVSPRSIVFPRSRFFALLSGAVFGLAGRLALGADSAQAGHENAPLGCFGYGRCHCCNGTRCCMQGCDKFFYRCPGRYNRHCWISQGPKGEYVACCDWKYHRSGERKECICKAAVN